MLYDYLAYDTLARTATWMLEWWECFENNLRVPEMLPAIVEVIRFSRAEGESQLWPPPRGRPAGGRDAAVDHAAALEDLPEGAEPEEPDGAGPDDGGGAAGPDDEPVGDPVDDVSQEPGGDSETRAEHRETLLCI